MIKSYLDLINTTINCILIAVKVCSNGLSTGSILVNTIKNTFLGALGHKTKEESTNSTLHCSVKAIIIGKVSV